MAQLYSLIYVSSEAFEMSDDDLMGLLEVSQKANVHKKITGMLIYKSGSFLQLLEGEKELVLSTFDRVCKDRRHQCIQLIISHNVSRRSFEDWSMGFVDMGKIKDFSPYPEYINSNVNLRDFSNDASYAKKFIQSFSQMI